MSLKCLQIVIAMPFSPSIVVFYYTLLVSFHQFFAASFLYMLLLAFTVISSKVFLVFIACETSIYDPVGPVGSVGWSVWLISVYY